MTATDTTTLPMVSGKLRRALLAWYDRHRRDLPWRARPGETPDAYRVWLSEIMLQQTTVAAVRSYYEAFVRRWPRVSDLAAADLDDVLVAWQGLGYYARARNLHACARLVAGTYRGRFPRTSGELRSLPGVGPYTAAAIAAIVYDEPVVPVDGNVLRVLARLCAISTPLPNARLEIERIATRLASDARPGDFAQALMELGATVCRPGRPRCESCPWSKGCRAAAAGDPEVFPRKAPKATKPIRHGVAFWVRRTDGAVLLRRRPTRGLLGGMMEVPSTDWRSEPWSASEAKHWAPAAARWQPLDGVVGHAFTHFHLELSVLSGRAEEANGDGIWCRPRDLNGQALPTVMRKIIRLALSEVG